MWSRVVRIALGVTGGGVLAGGGTGEATGAVRLIGVTVLETTAAAVRVGVDAIEVIVRSGDIVPVGLHVASFVGVRTGVGGMGWEVQESSDSRARTTSPVRVPASQ
jgi:hypothetical protein